jgi:FAD/FMN-containing dehydrogenase
VHYNLLQPAAMAPEAFIALKDEVQRQVFDLVASLGGTISAEHGIGRLKRAELAARKSPLELALMRQIKQTLDPKGILNPGAVL